MHDRFYPDDKEHGYTLAELLVVIAVLLAITLIVIPNVAGFNLQANENSAIASLRSIYQAELQYGQTYPALGFACSLPALGGKVGSGAPTPQGAQLLPSDLASGGKSGYRFYVTNCMHGDASDKNRVTGFEIVATPRILGKTGHRGFCESTDGLPKADPTGGTACTESLQ